MLPCYSLGTTPQAMRAGRFANGHFAAFQRPAAIASFMYMKAAVAQRQAFHLDLERHAIACFDCGDRADLFARARIGYAEKIDGGRIVSRRLA